MLPPLRASSSGSRATTQAARAAFKSSLGCRASPLTSFRALAHASLAPAASAAVRRSCARSTSASPAQVATLVRRKLDAALASTSAAGIVPLPGSGKAAEVLARAASSFLRTSVATWAGDALVDLAQDRLTAALAAGASDAWASALNEVSGEARQPKEDLKAALAAWVVALDPEELALRGGNIEHYVQVLVASYDAVSGAAAD